MAALHALIGDHVGDSEPADVVAGIETDRGTWVQALIAAGYRGLCAQPDVGGSYPQRRNLRNPREDRHRDVPFPSSRVLASPQRRVGRSYSR
jgi:hypothetical protein